MTTNLHEMAVSVPIGNGERAVDVQYTYTPGSPATHELAADPPEVEVYSMKVHGDAVPKWFEQEALDYVTDWLLDHHEPPGPDPDDAYDARRDDGPTLIERLSA